jgi:hypothetical protein
MSRKKICKEASRPTPRLRQLVGHATIYDNASRFISTWIDDSSESEQSEMAIEEEPRHQSDERVLDNMTELGLDDQKKPKQQEQQFEITHHASFNGYAQLEKKAGTPIVVTTVPIEPGSEQEGDSTSDSSSESEDDGEFVEIKAADVLPLDVVGSGKQKLWDNSMPTTTVVSLERVGGRATEDIMLWTQQPCPEMMTVHEAASVLVDACG